MARKRKAAAKPPAMQAKRGRARRKSSAFRNRLMALTPPGWMSNLMASQTGRVIMAEALVAAAGAAAAVLVASRTERGERARVALMQTGRGSAAVMKEAAKSAASAAGEVIAAMATDAISNVAKQVLSGSERVEAMQQDLARKAGLNERGRHH